MDKAGVSGGAKRRGLSQRVVTCWPQFGAYIYNIYMGRHEAGKLFHGADADVRSSNRLECKSEGPIHEMADLTNETLTELSISPERFWHLIMFQPTSLTKNAILHD